MATLRQSPAGRAPLLHTERLVLRDHRTDDFQACAAMWGNPQVTRHISGTPSAPDESWARLLRYAGHWTLLGYGFWVVAEKASGRFLGEVGFADHKRTIEPSLDGMPEIGWAFEPSAHGTGYATEAVSAAISWADANLAATRTSCLIAPQNAASLNVARKCGYGEFARTTYKEKPAIVLTREATRS